jgi:hypothetical protein
MNDQHGSRHRTLDAIIRLSEQLKPVRKADLEFGDRMIVSTTNSTYSIDVLDEGFYLVSGGWFDRHGVSPLKTTINGCTWGGSVISLNIMAACGLHLEFGNCVVTSRIREFHVIHCPDNQIS